MEEVSRTFAGMLGDLEDMATELIERQSALARELDGVSAELERVEAVRAAMMGKPAKKPVRRAYGSGATYKLSDEAKERVERIKAWAKDRDGFRGGEAASVLDVPPQRVGPILAGMVRRGELIADGKGNGRRYSLAEG